MLTLFICIPGPAGAKILHAKYSIFEQARFSRQFSGGMWKPVLTLAWSSRDHLGWSLPLFMSSWIDFLGSEEYIYYQLCTRTTYATLLTSKALMSLIRFPAFFILREFCRTSPSNVVAEEFSDELLTLSLPGTFWFNAPAFARIPVFFTKFQKCVEKKVVQIFPWN